MSGLWVEIDLDAVKHNYRQILAKLSPGCTFMAVLKADAYGLGAVELAKALEEEGCSSFAVTHVGEALLLREQGIAGQILVLGPSGQEDWQEAIARNIELTVSRPDWLQPLNQAAAAQGAVAGIHLKLETGMGRTGLRREMLADVCAALQSAQNIQVVGAYTHLARGAQRDEAYSRAQHARFREYLDILEEQGLQIPVKHICNSAGLLDFPEYHYELVRCGTLLIGHYPAPAFAGMLDLKDPWTAKARISHLQRVPKGTFVGYQSIYKSPRETTLAVIPAGYADGFGIEPKLVPQGLVDLAKITVKNIALLFGKQLGREKVLVRGQAVRVAGKIGMQLTVLDVGDLDCRPGDEVIVPLRRTLANPRIPRIYKKNGQFYSKRIIKEGFLPFQQE